MINQEQEFLYMYAGRVEGLLKMAYNNLSQMVNGDEGVLDDQSAMRAVDSLGCIAEAIALIDGDLSSFDEASYV